MSLVEGLMEIWNARRPYHLGNRAMGSGAIVQSKDPKDNAQKRG